MDNALCIHKGDVIKELTEIHVVFRRCQGTTKWSDYRLMKI